MDPSTTLITFLFQTELSVRSVQLIGSWDKFSSSYAMSRDVRRGRGQWRGCYSFENIACDDGVTVSALCRNGGLKMGATYYYYYEVDGSIETYDPTEPSTTSCPYLPGQTVNTLSVPVERSSRQRRASLNSLHDENFKTMDPNARFITSQSVPTSDAETTIRRLGSASTLPNLWHDSPPPAPFWKRFFNHRSPSDDLNQASASDLTLEHSILCPQRAAQIPYPTSSTGSNSRYLSSEALMEFLAGDVPLLSDLGSGHSSPTLLVPEDTEEETEDDNFTFLAASEHHLYTMRLLPRSFQRSKSSDIMAQASTNISLFTLTTDRPLNRQQPSCKERSPRLWDASDMLKLEIVEEEPPSFDEFRDDEIWPGNDNDNFSHSPQPSSRPSNQQAIRGYSLPRQGDEIKGVIDSNAAATDIRAPHFHARCDAAAQLAGATLLENPVDTGLHDFVSELSWMIDVIDSEQS